MRKAKTGRGSKLTFLSNDMQNKLITIIDNEITKVIVDKIRNSIAWSVILDTTPDVTHKEQVSIFVCVIMNVGEVFEHLLCLKRASSTTAEALLNILKTSLLERQTNCYNTLVAQAYDGASDMSGQYGGLQALIKRYW